MTGPLAQRISSVPWGNYVTAYGSAIGVEAQLLTLASHDHEAAMAATHELWCGLCHQHAFVSSAALPSYPFLFEILQTADDKLKIEILDILLGFASCSHPDTPLRDETDRPWRNRLHAEMQANRLHFENLKGSDDEEVSDFAGRIVSFL